MKLIAGVILSLSLLELFHCVPLIGSDDEGFKETNTTTSWNYGAGVDVKLGFEGGWKNGHGTLGTVNRVGFDVGGNKTNSQKETNYAINPVPAPNNAGSGLGSPNYPAPGSPYYPATGALYYPAIGPVNYPAPGQVNYPANGLVNYPAPGQVNYPAPGPVNYPAPGAPYYNQFTSQPIQQWPTPQGSPQGPQGAQQHAPTQQYPPAQQYAAGQQFAPAQQYGQHGAPALQYALAEQFAPVPLNVPQGSPQQFPQGTPQYAPANGAPNENHNIQ